MFRKKGENMVKKFIYLCVFEVVQMQKTEAAPQGAGAGGGPAWQQNWASKEWYTIVVYERPRLKTVVVYVGDRVFAFKAPACAVVSAEVLKMWRIGNTVAYSARIYAADLAELINTYVETRVADAAAHAGGVQLSAETLDVVKNGGSDVCREVNNLVSDLRSDLVLAMRMDEFVGTVNRGLQVGAELRGEALQLMATPEHVKHCLKHDDSVKIIVAEDGGEALWLWGGWYMHHLVYRVTRNALRYGTILAEAEKYDDVEELI
jgi:hypothetical protein